MTDDGNFVWVSSLLTKALLVEDGATVDKSTDESNTAKAEVDSDCSRGAVSLSRSRTLLPNRDGITVDKVTDNGNGDPLLFGPCCMLRTQYGPNCDIIVCMFGFQVSNHAACFVARVVSRELSYT